MLTAPTFDAPVADWLVYADWLQQQGDPRGELIGLVHAGDEAKRDAFVRANAAALLGRAAEHNGVWLSVRWRWCFADVAEVRGSTVEGVVKTLDAVLSSPVAERLWGLRLVGVPGASPAPLDLSPVLARIPSTVSSLTLVDDWAENATSLTSRDFDPPANLVTFGPLTPLWGRAGLQRLKLVLADTQQLVPGTIASEHLTSLTIHGLRVANMNHGEVNPSALAVALGTARLPALKEFDMRLCEQWTANTIDDSDAYNPTGSEGDGDEHNEGSDWEGEFGDALRRLVQSPLERLALTSFDSTASLLGLIGKTGLPPTLKELDLSDSALSHADLAWFTSHRSLLARLDRLVVNNTGLTADDAAVLARLVPKLVHSLREPAEFDPDFDGDDESGTAPFPIYRYVVGME